MKKTLLLLGMLVFILTLMFASVALAHGAEAHGAEAGIPWLNITLVAAGLIAFAGGGYFAVKPRE
jgi:hypothetical protein